MQSRVFDYIPTEVSEDAHASTLLWVVFPEVESGTCIWCPRVRDRLHGVITYNATFRSYVTVL